MVAVSDPKMSYDFAGLGALKADAVRDRSDEATIKKTAQQFEAMFLQMMMKSMRATVQKGGLFDSSETETFEQMLDQQFALAMAGRRSTGLSQMIERFITQSQGDRSATDAIQKKFSLQVEDKIPLPLVKKSAGIPFSEGTTETFLLNRQRMKVGGGD
jgi:flagellar protein FlgJ